MNRDTELETNRCPSSASPDGTAPEEAGSPLPPEGKIAVGKPPTPCFWECVTYWLGLPFRWAYQMAHNGLGILRVLDIIRFRPMPPGLIGEDHPWVSGRNPETGKLIWHENVLY